MRYACNTAIVYLEEKSPASPFTFAEVVLSVLHHEAHAIRAPDGNVLVYMIKYDGGEFPGVLECFEWGLNSSSHLVIAVAWSSSVYGPWQERILALPDKMSIRRICPKWHSYYGFQECAV